MEMANEYWAKPDEEKSLVKFVKKGCNEMIDYSPLWETMKKKQISQYALLKCGIDNKTLDSLKKNKNITLLTLEKLCIILDCTPNDIVRFTSN